MSHLGFTPPGESPLILTASRGSQGQAMPEASIPESREPSWDE